MHVIGITIRPRSLWVAAVLLFALLTLATCTDGGSSAWLDVNRDGLPDPPEVEPFSVAEVPKPSAVDRWEAASISPDGQWIAFQFQGPDTGGIERIGIVQADGTGFRCVSCAGDIDGGRPTWFPDSKRILMRSFASTFAVVDIETGAVIPGEGVETSNDLQNRVVTLSPDGTKLAWTKIWADGTAS